jgi:hypothetical protein
MCAPCGASYDKTAHRDGSVLEAMLWAAKRARQFVRKKQSDEKLLKAIFGEKELLKRPAILELAKTRYERAAAASRAASTGTALTAPVEKIRELQYAMGRADEALGAFRGIQALLGDE